MKKLHIILVALALPLTALAASAGTDGYLREIGYSDEQLSNEAPTEEREAFLLAEGVGRVEDPLGDVLDRFGVTSILVQPWGDIADAILAKNENTQTWDLTVTFGGAVPDAPTVGAQLFFYMDTDGDATNNAPEGIRIGTDAEFGVKYDATLKWSADYRWYNPDADFWATNKDTSATFEIAGNTLTLHVPFSEAPSSLAPNWRVAFAVADAANTQIDVAPGIGFPPPKGETYPVVKTGLTDSLPWLGVLVSLLAAAYIVKRTVAKKRRV